MDSEPSASVHDTVREHRSAKRRALSRACDLCRRRKIKCDGQSKRDTACSNCAASKVDCIYTEGLTHKDNLRIHIDQLENYIDKLEIYIRKISPALNMSQAFGLHPRYSAPLFEFSSSSHTLAPSTPSVVSMPLPSNPTAYRKAQDMLDSEDEGEPTEDPRSGPTFLHRWLERAQDTPGFPRLAGKSGMWFLIQIAFELKGEYDGSHLSPVPEIVKLMHQRPAIWEPNTWESREFQHFGEALEQNMFKFPEEDLMPSLINLYFEHFNIYSPLLHQRTFARELNSGLHLRDRVFAAVVLAVCALGAGFSDDERVIFKREDDIEIVGWQWLRQASSMLPTPWKTPSLYHLQLCVLIPRYLMNTRIGWNCWIIVNTGLRLAQDIGVHRRSVYNKSLTPVDELWKRAFWALLELDRTISWFAGRSPSLHDEDFDVELPATCDDEHWEGSTPFQQPVGASSSMDFFNYLLRLHQINSLTLRTMYSVNARKPTALEPQQTQDIVAHIDSAMNKWLESIPDHLRWDPHRENTVFFDQSAALFATFYTLQISVHRNFLIPRSRTRAYFFPSLAICVNAARSISHIVEALLQRHQHPMPFHMFAAGMAAGLLIINAYGIKRTGLTLNHAKELSDVRRCLTMLKTAETRFQHAGKGWDVLNYLMSSPSPPATAHQSSKRRREEDNGDTHHGGDGSQIHELSGVNGAHHGIEKVSNVGPIYAASFAAPHWRAGPENTNHRDAREEWTAPDEAQLNFLPSSLAHQSLLPVEETFTGPEVQSAIPQLSDVEISAIFDFSSLEIPSATHLTAPHTEAGPSQDDWAWIFNSMYGYQEYHPLEEACATGNSTASGSQEYTGASSASTGQELTGFLQQWLPQW